MVAVVECSRLGVEGQAQKCHFPQAEKYPAYGSYLAHFLQQLKYPEHAVAKSP